MKNQKPRNIKIVRVFDILSLITSVIFVIGLTLNVSSRVDIISILEKRSFGGVENDVPLLYPLFAGLIFSALSFYFSKGKTSKLWIIAITALITGLFIWYFGLHHEMKNSFQFEIGS